MDEERSPRIALLGAVCLAMFLWHEGCGVPGAFMPMETARPNKTVAVRTPSAVQEPLGACWKPPKAGYTREELLALTACQPPFGIAAGMADYSPVMSSVPGLPFSARIPKGAPEGLTLRWRTDFGFFVTWKEPIYEVVNLGPSLSGSEQTVYWTYDPALSSAPKPEVHIALDAVGKDGKVLATAGQLLGWEHDTAVVRR